MKKSTCLMIVMFISMVLTTAVYAHPIDKRLKEQQTSTGKPVSVEAKIEKLEKKMDKILDNQEKILKEMDILKIRIRRS